MDFVLVLIAKMHYASMDFAFNLNPTVSFNKNKPIKPIISLQTDLFI